MTMKLTTKSSSGIFKKVPEFLQISTDRLHLVSGRSLPTFSWMIWHHKPLPGVFGCRDYAVFCFYVFWLFYDFRTCRVIHHECVYLISHISKFSSKFCNIDCLTLHPPRAVVCRPRQTRVDVHLLVVIYQEYRFGNMPFQEPEQKLVPKKKLLPKNMLLPKNKCYCQPSRFPWIPHEQWVLALEKY